MKTLISAIRTAVADFLEDDCMSNGAAIAYYTIFSLPPLLVLVFLVATAFNYSHEDVEQVVREQLGMPTEAVSTGAETPEEGGSNEESGAIPAVGNFGLASKIVGIFILVFSATGVFAQLQYALNRAWEVEPDPEQGGVMAFLLKRVLSLGMIVVIGFLLLVSLVMTTMIQEIVQATQGATAGPVAYAVAAILNTAASLAVATILFAAMFKILPDAKIPMRDVWVGAALTAVLFVIGKSLIGWYLQQSNMGGGWGSAAASMIAALVWVYYSSLIVLFGAEVTQAWIRAKGGRIEPSKGAVKKVQEKKYIRPGSSEPVPAK